KLGLVEAADGGTLFLDEIGELEAATQAKLLKLLEDRTVRRLGSVRDQAVDIQVLSATNRSLSRMVAEGRFREDLFYRLNVVTVEVPPLRERGQDRLALARHFVAELGARYGKPALVLDPSAESAILKHAWPGNVRELRNTMEQAVLYATGPEVRDLDLSLPRTSSTAAADPSMREPPIPAETRPSITRLDDVERALIARTLAEVDGNVSKAARRLGITRDRLRYRIEKHGLTPKD
ncbi:MAG: sigma 54-interacting transcriptional regulator, partial [Chromatiaceae bacterium]